MKARTLPEVFLGFSVAMGFISVCILAELHSTKDLLRRTPYQGLQPHYQYSEEVLDLSKMDNLVSSVVALIGYGSPFSLKLNNVYCISGEGTIHEYISNDNLLSVITCNDEVICCKFTTEDANIKQGVKSLTWKQDERMPFVYKDVRSGFVLEQEC